MSYYGIYVNGALDCDPCPMIFNSSEEASAALANIRYDETDEIEIEWVPDAIAEPLILEYYGPEYLEDSE